MNKEVRRLPNTHYQQNHIEPKLNITHRMYPLLNYNEQAFVIIRC